MRLFTQIPLMPMVKEISHNHLNLQCGLYCDFLLVNDFQEPVAVIEIDGSGHNSSRDSVKDSILEKARIDVLRIDTRNWSRRKNYHSFMEGCILAVLNSWLEKQNDKAGEARMK